MGVAQLLSGLFLLALPIIFICGLTWVSAIVSPWLIPAFFWTLVISIFILGPLAVIRKTRGGFRCWSYGCLLCLRRMPLDDLVEPRVTTNEQRAKSLVRHLVSKRAWAKPTSVLEGGRSGRTIFVNQLTGVYRAREHKRPSETMKILTLPTLMTAAYFVARGDQHAGCASVIAPDGTGLE
jgi:hypothetical protein